MKREDIINFCRYYRGEDECPYEEEDQNKSMLWFYERAWVIDMVQHAGDEDRGDEMISEYVNVGLGSFANDDDIPLSLKALLFNRYARGSYSMLNAVEPFKRFYTEYYSKETNE